jgi:hypothetical protein
VDRENLGPFGSAAAAPLRARFRGALPNGKNSTGSSLESPSIDSPGDPSSGERKKSAPRRFPSLPPPGLQYRRSFLTSPPGGRSSQPTPRAQACRTGGRSSQYTPLAQARSTGGRSSPTSTPGGWTSSARWISIRDAEV